MTTPGALYPSNTFYPGDTDYPGTPLSVSTPATESVVATAPQICDVAQEVYDALPPAWTEQDAENGYVLAILCDALTRSGMQPLSDYGLDQENGTPGWATLFTLADVTARTARYLGQFVGVTVPAGLTDTQAQAMLTTHPGYARGRPATLVAAVQATLTGSQKVNLLERDTSAWHATVQVYSAQMPSQSKTLAAIAANKPAADIVDLQVLSGPTYAQTRSATGGPGTSNYGLRKTRFPTYSDIQGYVSS